MLLEFIDKFPIERTVTFLKAFSTNDKGVVLMKRLILILMISFVSVMLMANFSLGLAFGEPSGLSAKYEVSPNMAFDFGIAYSFLWGISGYSFHADILYLFPNVIIIDGNRIPLYAGAGASYLGVVGLAEYGAYWIRARIPFGVYYPLSINRNFNIEPFFEIAPTISVVPSFGFDLSACIGVRYIF